MDTISTGGGYHQHIKTGRGFGTVASAVGNTIMEKNGKSPSSCSTHKILILGL